MRLGDLDALRQHSNTFHTSDGPVEAVPLDELDAAPTVECAACEHPVGEGFSYCHGCRCGSNFRRRQP